MTTTRLAIEGMRCAGCVSSVEKALKRVEGVTDARVNLATHSADVDHADGESIDEQLTAAVERAGYHAHVDRPRGAAHAGPHAGHEHDAHADQAMHTKPKRWHLWLSMLALPVVVLGMAWMSSTSAWVQLALATPVQVLLGWPFYRGTWKSLIRGRADMDSLVAIGTSVAFIYSAVVTIRGGHMVYFDTAVVILVLINFGRYLEARATAAAGSAIGELMSLQPRQAIRVEAGREVETPIDEVREGDMLMVKPGASVPVDGRVVDGQSSIDQSLVTGESMPVEVKPGDRVFAGTVNQSGAFRMEATATGAGMLLSQISEQVRNAQASKANIQRLADRVAGVFVPAVLVIALGTLLVWGLGGFGWAGAMSATVAVLIVACPCALGLATPTAIMVGSGLGAKHGILIKSAAAFERAGKLTHVLFDKTGTLTKGRPAVTDVVSLSDDWPREAVLRIAAALERRSEHPLAKAVLRAAEKDGIDAPQPSEFESITGGGIRGRVEGRVVIVGKAQTLREASVEFGERLDAERGTLMEQGKTTVAVAVDNRAVGLLGFSDELRDEAPDAIKAIKALGLRTAMVTGDNQQVADAIAKRAGIDRVYAECLPGDKQKVVRELQRAPGSSNSVAMVGDGINDAPALAAADLGIAVGGGTDIAKDAGHIVLVGADLWNVPRAVRLSRATMRRIIVGLIWAFGYNILLIPVAAFGLLHPMLAAGAMSLSSVSVVCNALWLKRSWKD